MPAAQPKVSIMIPAYNQDRFIGATVASALAQSYGNLEIIVSDNASSDGTARIVTNMLDDKRLRYHRNPTNIGRVANYYHLLHELATGEFVILVDGDDILTNPNFVERAVQLALTDPEIVLVFGKILQGTDVSTAVAQNEALSIPSVMDGNDFFLGHPPYVTVGVGLFHLCVLYRRQAALAIGTYSMDVLSVDYEAFYRLILGRKVGYLDEFAGLWRQHEANTSQGYCFNSLLANFQALRSPFEAAMKQQIATLPQIATLRRKAYSSYYLSCIKAAIRHRRLADALRFTRHVLALDPGIAGHAPRIVIDRMRRMVMKY